MRSLLTPWRLVLVLLGGVAQQFRLFERGFFILQEWRHASEWRGRSIWLPDYQVAIEAKPVVGRSDESRLVLESNADGRPISTLSLLRGMHGLQRGVPQAEGVAMDNDGNLYLVSEPNLFYVFRKQAAD